MLVTDAISHSNRLHYFTYIYPALRCTSFLSIKPAVFLFQYNFSRPSGFREEVGHTPSTCLQIWHIIPSRTPFIHVIYNKQWRKAVYCPSIGMRFSRNFDGRPARSQSWECCCCIMDAVMTRKFKLPRRKSLRNHSTLQSKATHVLQETDAAELLW